MVPVLVFLILAGTGLYFMISIYVEDFADRSIRENLSSLSNALFRIADRAVDELNRKYPDDKNQRKRYKVKVFMETENFARQNEIGLIVYSTNKNVIVFDTGIPEATKKIVEQLGWNREQRVSIPNKGTYYSRSIVFKPWNWRIILLKNTSAYSSLVKNVRHFYLVTGLILIIIAIFLIVYLRREIGQPINQIITRLRKGKAPEYKGISELEFLSDSFCQIMESLQERQRVEYELRSAKEKVENELKIAAQIQRSILPSNFPAFPEHNEFDLYAMMIPAREVGGDFYDFFFVDDNHLAMIIADVSDKGIPAALFMMISRTIFRSITKQRKSPSEVLTETNNLLCEGNDTGMFVTAFLSFYNLSTGELTYSNGGHNPPLLFGPNGICRELDCKHGPALGVKPMILYEEDVEKIESGEFLVLYTDGVTEALSPHDELFGVDRFTNLVCSCDAHNLSQMFDHIAKDLKEFQRGNQFDDITMLMLKREA